MNANLKPKKRCCLVPILPTARKTAKKIQQENESQQQQQQQQMVQEMLRLVIEQQKQLQEQQRQQQLHLEQIEVSAVSGYADLGRLGRQGAALTRGRGPEVRQRSRSIDPVPVDQTPGSALSRADSQDLGSNVSSRFSIARQRSESPVDVYRNPSRHSDRTVESPRSTARQGQQVQSQGPSGPNRQGIQRKNQLHGPQRSQPHAGGQQPNRLDSRRSPLDSQQDSQPDGKQQLDQQDREEQQSDQPDTQQQQPNRPESELSQLDSERLEQKLESLSMRSESSVDATEGVPTSPPTEKVVLRLDDDRPLGLTVVGRSRESGCRCCCCCRSDGDSKAESAADLGVFVSCVRREGTAACGLDVEPGDLIVGVNGIDIGRLSNRAALGVLMREVTRRDERSLTLLLASYWNLDGSLDGDNVTVTSSVDLDDCRRRLPEAEAAGVGRRPRRVPARNQPASFADRQTLLYYPCGFGTVGRAFDPRSVGPFGCEPRGYETRRYPSFSRCLAPFSPYEESEKRAEDRVQKSHPAVPRGELVRSHAHSRAEAVLASRSNVRFDGGWRYPLEPRVFVSALTTPMNPWPVTYL